MAHLVDHLTKADHCHQVVGGTPDFGATCRHIDHKQIHANPAEGDQEEKGGRQNQIPGGPGGGKRVVEELVNGEEERLIMKWHGEKIANK